MNSQGGAEPAPSEVRSPIASLIATLALAAAVPALLILGFDAAFKWLALGAASWIVGVVVKVPLTALTHFALGGHREADEARSVPSDLGRAASLGLVSSGSELVAAVLILAWAGGASASLADLLAYAAGAGCFENFLLLGASFLEKPKPGVLDEWTAGARESWLVRNATFVERTVALVLHVSARGLAGLSLQSGCIHCAVVAIGAFATIDGTADLAESRGWAIYSPRTFARFFGFLAAVAGFSSLTIVLAVVL